MANAGKWSINYDFVGVSLGFRRGFLILFGLEFWQVFICVEETTN